MNTTLVAKRIQELHLQIGGPPPRSTVDRTKIGQLLEMICNDVPNLGALDVRLVDPQANGKLLYLTAVAGKFWDTVDQSLIELSASSELDATSPDHSISSRVLLTGEPAIFRTPVDWGTEYSPTFYSEIESLAAVPIRSRSEVIGVIYGRHTDRWNDEDGDAIVDVLELAANEVARIVLDRVSNERRDEVAGHFLNDLAHQVTAPLAQATLRLRTFARDNSKLAHVSIASALINRALRTVHLMRALGDLLEGRAPTVEMERSPASALLRSIDRIGEEESLRTRNGGTVDVEIDPRLEYVSIAYNPDATETIVAELINNAAKYSYEKEDIEVSVKRTEHVIEISVTNRGIRLGQLETQAVFQRGWQSDSAGMVAGEGSGIGLWVADNLAKAQAMTLTVTPSDEADQTTFVLSVPISDVE